MFAELIWFLLWGKNAIFVHPTRGQSSTRLGHIIDEVKT
jgi:hypothetical protein